MAQANAQKYYVGIAAGFHDGAIALVNENGEIVFAEATERFTQNKRSLAIVADNFFLINKVIKAYPFSDYEIGVNWKLFSSLPIYLISAFSIYIIRKYLKFNSIVAKYIFKIDRDLFSTIADFQASSQFAMLSTVGASLKNAVYLRLKLPYKSNSYFDHHTCHAYYAFYTSGFSNATIVILDGNGDEHISYTIFTADNQSIKKVFKNKGRASLGDFFGEITKWCGFSDIGGEQWKVMGMAPYGKMNEPLYQDLKTWIFIEKGHIKKSKSEQVIKNKILSGAYPGLSTQDIAFTCQAFYETIIIDLLNSVYINYPNNNLVIAGGCALNSAANGKVHTHTPFKNVYIPPAPADDGCAAGAALLSFKKHNPDKDIPSHQSNPYLGFDIQEPELEYLKKYSGYKHQKLPYERLYRLIAEQLQQGKIIGWVQGKAEFGPRALGNRSILANPMHADMKDRINAHVKFREEFRPFAPAILEEFAGDYFEDYYPTPYMERVLTIKENKRALLQAVNHIDNTGRLQTVNASMNAHFYMLINEFFKLTDVPVILNTSFNVMGKPIVNSVADMAAVFATSGLDLLVINDTVFIKNEMSFS